MARPVDSTVTWVSYWIDVKRPYQDDRMIEAVKTLLQLPIQLVVYMMKPKPTLLPSLIPTNVMEISESSDGKISKPPLNQQIIDLLEQKAKQSHYLQIRYLDQLFYQLNPEELNRLYNANRNPHFAGEKDTPEYCQLMWNKFAILADVAKNNPFQQTNLSQKENNEGNVGTIGWIDLGLGRICQLKEGSFERINQWIRAKPDRLDKKVRLALIKRPPDLLLNADFYQITHGYMVCGLMLSNSTGWIHINGLFQEELFTCIKDQIITLEEKILLRVFQRHPKLFSLHYGDYHDTLNNLVIIEQNFSFLIHFLKDESKTWLCLKRAKSLWKAHNFHKWNLITSQQLDTLIYGLLAAYNNQRYDWFWRFTCALEERIFLSPDEGLSLRNRPDFQELERIKDNLTQSDFTSHSSLSSSDNKLSSFPLSSFPLLTDKDPSLIEIIVHYPDRAVHLIGERLSMKGFRVKIWNLEQTSELKWSNPSYHRLDRIKEEEKLKDEKEENKRVKESDWVNHYRYDPNYLAENYKLTLSNYRKEIIRVSWRTLFSFGSLLSMG